MNGSDALRERIEAVYAKRGYEDSIGRWMPDPIGRVVLWDDIRATLDATNEPEHTYTLLEDAAYVRDDGQRDVLLSGTKVRLVSASVDREEKP